MSECSPQRLCQEGAGHSGELPGAAQQLGVWRERDGRCACCPRKNPAPPSCSASPEAQRQGLCSGPVGTEIRGPLTQRLTQMQDRCEDPTGQPRYPTRCHHLSDREDMQELSTLPVPQRPVILLLSLVLLMAQHGGLDCTKRPYVLAELEHPQLAALWLLVQTP